MVKLPVIKAQSKRQNQTKVQNSAKKRLRSETSPIDII